jgi:hypothetical protein
MQRIHPLFPLTAWSLRRNFGKEVLGWIISSGNQKNYQRPRKTRKRITLGEKGEWPPGKGWRKRRGKKLNVKSG